MLDVGYDIGYDIGVDCRVIFFGFINFYIYFIEIFLNLKNNKEKF